MNVVSVKCASGDAHLHLAPYQPGIGTERLTLCLEPWAKQEQAREDSILCAECVAKWAATQIRKGAQHSNEAH